MANTNILIKRSGVTGNSAPSSLLAGELAYSYNSNTAFIGSPTGNGVVKIGGQYYTSQIDNATSANTPNSLVRRDATGNADFHWVSANYFEGSFVGNAESATKLLNSRNFEISGGDITSAAVAFDGTAGVVLSANLNNVPGLTAGTYGSDTAVPVITVAANGRVTAISTQGITTSFTVAGDSGTQTISGGDTLTLTGGEGITTTASATDTVTFDVDDTVVRSNAFTGGTQTINTNLTIGSGKDLIVTGNLTITGNISSQNVQQLAVADPLIVLGIGNYTSDTRDIGFAAHYNDGANAHTGLIRNADGDKEYYFFEGYTPDVDANNNINIADASFRKSNVNANYFKGNLIATTIDVSGLSTVANVLPSTDGVYSLGSPSKRFRDLYLSGETLDIGGATLRANNGTFNVTTANGTSFQLKGTGPGNSTLNTDNLTLTNALEVQYGGTGATTFSSGALIIGNGTNALSSLANSSYVLTGSLAASKTITSLTVDAYGRVTAATGADIAIDTSQITSGTLGYSRGGTGSTSYTTGGLLIAGASGFQSLANTSYVATGSGASNNTITSVTVDDYGRLTAATFSAISGLTVAQGGTGLSSITQNGVTYGNGTGNLGVTAAAGAADQTWSNQILTVTNAGVPVWTSALDGGTF
jgi:hypothetical protein